jgi:hypothetical protein
MITPVAIAAVSTATKTSSAAWGQPRQQATATSNVPAAAMPSTKLADKPLAASTQSKAGSPGKQGASAGTSVGKDAADLNAQSSVKPDAPNSSVEPTPSAPPTAPIRNPWAAKPALGASSVPFPSGSVHPAPDFATVAAPTEAGKSAATETIPSAPAAPAVSKETDKPASGAADKPASGAADKPASGAADKPASGAAGKPVSGAADKPATGATDKPATGATDKPATGTTGTKASGPATSQNSVVDTAMTQKSGKEAATSASSSFFSPPKGNTKFAQNAHLLLAEDGGDGPEETDAQTPQAGQSKKKKKKNKNKAGNAQDDSRSNADTSQASPGQADNDETSPGQADNDEASPVKAGSAAPAAATSDSDTSVAKSTVASGPSGDAAAGTGGLVQKTAGQPSKSASTPSPTKTEGARQAESELDFAAEAGSTEIGSGLPDDLLFNGTEAGRDDSMMIAEDSVKQGRSLDSL